LMDVERFLAVQTLIPSSLNGHNDQQSWILAQSNRFAIVVIPAHEFAGIRGIPGPGAGRNR
jgi:hypothetical protein